MPDDVDLTIPWGDEESIPLRLPPGWAPALRGEPAPPPPVDPAAGVVAGFAAPIGCPAVLDRVGRFRRVALVMEDIGRPTPVESIVDPLLSLLLDAGLDATRIRGLFALGTHREMSWEEMARRAGARAASTIELSSVDCRKSEHFVNLGRTSRGTPVVLRRDVVEADLRILVGTIEPHPQAGFGGGWKNVLPGLAGAEAVAANHLLMPSADHYNMIGTDPERNPMRLDLEEACVMLGGTTLIVNVVLDPRRRPVGVFVGDPLSAHRAGVALAARIYGVPVSEPADIVVAGAYPMHMDLRQAGKAILNTAGACRKGGTLVGYLACPEGLGNVAMPSFRLPLGPARVAVRILGSAGIAAVIRLLPASIAGEGRFMINFGLQILKDYRVFLYSPSLHREFGAAFPDVVFADQDEMWRRIARDHGHPPRIAMFPYGGVTYPVAEHRDSPRR